MTEIVNEEYTCELCLLKSNQVLNIFENEGRELDIATMLIKFFWFDVSRSFINNIHLF